MTNKQNFEGDPATPDLATTTCWQAFNQGSAGFFTRDWVNRHLSFEYVFCSVPWQSKHPNEFTPHRVPTTPIRSTRVFYLTLPRQCALKAWNFGGAHLGETGNWKKEKRNGFKKKEGHFWPHAFWDHVLLYWSRFILHFQIYVQCSRAGIWPTGYC